MQQLVTIISLSCLAFSMAELSGIPQWIRFKLKLKRLKPFDCNKCMGFWLGLIYYWDWNNYWTGLLYGGLCSILAVFICLTYHKLI